MTYISLYRKYRSQSFDEVSGQEHVTRTLQNAIRGDRVAHAYLFCGARGTGKTTTARLLAKCLNCEGGPTPAPCNECENCLRIADGSSMDVIEIDAASNRGIDEIRALREKVQYSPSQSRMKVYVLDEVHMLTSEAFNALLKTLEEPPAHVVFILATTEAHKIPATILSRCQRFDFRRGSLDQIGDRLRFVAEQEGYTIEPAAVARIARGAEGSWRDALSLLEQVLAYGEKTITLGDVTEVLGAVDADSLHALAEAVRTGDGAALFGAVEELVHAGKDPRQLTRDLVEHFRTLLRVAVGAHPATDESGARLAEQAAGFGLPRLVRSLESLAHVEKDARWSDQSRLALEVALVRLMREGTTGGDHRPPTNDQRPSTDDRRAAMGRAESRAQAARLTPPPDPLPQTERGQKQATPSKTEPPDSPLRLGEGRGEGSTPPRRVSEPARAYDPEAPGYDPFVEEALPDPDLASMPAEAAITEEAHDGFAPPPAAKEPEVEAGAPLDTAGDDAPGLAAIQSRWTVIVEELKRRKAMKTSALLSDARPVRLEGEKLTVRFKYDTHVEMFHRGDSREQLEAAIQSVVGGRYRVATEHGELNDAASPGSGGASSRPGAPVPRGGQPSSGSGATFARSSPSAEGGDDGGADRLIHEVIAIFNGKIIEE
jgi:DNA polymerase-3 subunit gamma/tau